MNVDLLSVRFALKKHDLIKPSRIREKVYKRNVFYKFMRDHTSLGVIAIGKMVDKDHASVLHGLKQHKTIKSYSDFREWENEFLPDLLECLTIDERSKCENTNEVMSLVTLENLIQEKL